NYRAAFVGLADIVSDGETKQFGPISGAVAGFSVPEYNRIFVFDPPSKNELTSAISWLKRQNVPFWATLSEPVVDTMNEFPGRYELKKSHEDRGMVLQLSSEIQSQEQFDDISAVNNDTMLEEFVAVFSSVFGRSEEITSNVYRPLVADNTTELFIGMIGEKPVACGVLSQSDSIAGLYSIGVLEDFRRQGLGEAMTRAILRSGWEAGCRMAVLQSTDMGYPLYKQMGFETVITYQHFEPTT
ncbi:MAG: GNAT family N-acetyltransferase, partial [Halobacteriaceae archaeon]